MEIKNKSEIEGIVENIVEIIGIVPKNELEEYHKERLEELKEEFVKSYKKIERNYQEEFQIISQPYFPDWRDDLLS